MPEKDYSDEEAAKALLCVLGPSSWYAVAFAKGYLAMLNGAEDDQAARIIYESGPQTLKLSKQLIKDSKEQGFLAQLKKGKK